MGNVSLLLKRLRSHVGEDAELLIPAVLELAKAEEHRGYVVRGEWQLSHSCGQIRLLHFYVQAWMGRRLPRWLHVSLDRGMFTIRAGQRTVQRPATPMGLPFHLVRRHRLESALGVGRFVTNDQGSFGFAEEIFCVGSEHRHEVVWCVFSPGQQRLFLDSEGQRLHLTSELSHVARRRMRVREQARQELHGFDVEKHSRAVADWMVERWLRMHPASFAGYRRTVIVAGVIPDEGLRQGLLFIRSNRGDGTVMGSFKLATSEQRALLEFRGAWVRARHVGVGWRRLPHPYGHESVRLDPYRGDRFVAVSLRCVVGAAKARVQFGAWVYELEIPARARAKHVAILAETRLLDEPRFAVLHRTPKGVEHIVLCPVGRQLAGPLVRDPRYPLGVLMVRQELRERLMCLLPYHLRMNVFAALDAVSQTAAGWSRSSPAGRRASDLLMDAQEALLHSAALQFERYTDPCAHVQHVEQALAYLSQVGRIPRVTISDASLVLHLPLLGRDKTLAARALGTCAPAADGLRYSLDSAPEDVAAFLTRTPDATGIACQEP